MIEVVLTVDFPVKYINLLDMISKCFCSSATTGSLLKSKYSSYFCYFTVHFQSVNFLWCLYEVAGKHKVYWENTFEYVLSFFCAPARDN